jgi:hypothetical protein
MELQILNEPAPCERAAILAGIVAFNASAAPTTKASHLAVALREAG